MLSKFKILIHDPNLFFKLLTLKIKRTYKRYVLRDAFTLAAAKWFRDRGDETLRLDYDCLTPESIVFDVGGYLGDFANAIQLKYNCYVYVFEPHPSFYQRCEVRFEANPKVKCYNFGLSDTDGMFSMSDSSNGSSFEKLNISSKQHIDCQVRKFSSVLKELNIERIDLMKINIEGGEFPLLAHILDSNLQSTIHEFQVQFHTFIENAKDKRANIQMLLNKTHVQTWCYYFIWENWKKK